MKMIYDAHDGDKKVGGVHINCYVPDLGLVFSAESVGNGYAERVIPRTMTGHGAMINIDHPGYTLPSIYIPSLEDKDYEVSLPLVPFGGGESPAPSPVVWPIHRDGKVLRQADGKIFATLGITATQLYKFWLEGQVDRIDAYVEDVIEKCPSVMFFRVFGMLHNITRFYPQDYGDRYYDEFPKFCAYFKEKWGRAIYFTMFADAAIVMGGYGDRVRHRDRLKGVTRNITNLFFEGCNEPQKTDLNMPGGDAEAYEHAVALSGGLPLCTSGASSEEAVANHHYGPDLVDIHPPRDKEWPRKLKDVLDLRDQTGLPCWAGEPIGINKDNKPGSRTNSPEDCATAGANAALHGLGSFIHGDDMHACVPLGEKVSECAKAWHDGAMWVPPEAQIAEFWRGTGSRDGQVMPPCHWTHAPGDEPGPAEHTDAIDMRSYAKTLGEDTYLLQCHDPDVPFRDHIAPCSGFKIKALGPSAGMAIMVRG